MKRILFVLILLSATLTALATHNRAGEITYRHINGFTFEFTITTYTDPASPADRDSLTIVYDANNPDITSEVLDRTSITPINSNIRKNTYVGIHTYPGPGNFVVYMQDPNRVEGIVNIEGSVNVPFYLEDTIFIPDPLFFGYNSSPILVNEPIDFANVGQEFIHNPNAFDPDGDSLSYEFITPLQDPFQNVPGFEQPNIYDDCGATFTIDEITGEIRWDTPCQVGIYNIAILIREFRDGELMGTVIRDMQIFVEDTPNDPPVVEAIEDTCVIAGEDLVINVFASDPNSGQILTLTANGGPLNVEESPAMFTDMFGMGSLVGTFEWSTVCSHVRKQFYQMIFKAEDDYSLGSEDIPLVDLESWLITVVGPPPLNVQAIAIGNRIEVSWDSLYTCFNTPNFRGFSVWRKTGCDSVEFEACQRGLSGTGYIKIAELDSLHHYTDEDVVRGQLYSYRILAEYSESAPPPSPFTFNKVSSRPSDAACAELKKDVPIITNVSVRETDASNGSIFIAWYRPDPDDLDTLENPGPYRYELYQDEGFIATAPTLLNTVISPNFESYIDSTYIDTFLNTAGTPYNYFVKFFASDDMGNFNEIDDSENASSVFLSLGAADNELNLSWQEEVPWSNFVYEIFKETPTGSDNFILLDTTSLSAYVDTGLANGSLYCYYIKSIGRYSSDGLPDTLINFSQRTCAEPIDTIPPCPPNLAVMNICTESADVPFVTAELKNELTWNNPNDSCADDVIKYYIYFSDFEGGDLTILDSLLSPEDTFYIHDNLSSLAGCYAITAIDSFFNESPLSNLVCVDNCPSYVLPNVFTPNGDGDNDFFTPFLPYRFVDRVEMKIYNRWGGLVFETEDPLISWDGKEQNSGKDLAEGVYYYVCNVFEVRVDGILPLQEPLSGYIHLIRGNGDSN